MKRFLALILILCMLCSMLPTFALAEDFILEPEVQVEFLPAEEAIPEEDLFIPVDEASPVQEASPEQAPEPEELPEEISAPMMEAQELLLEEELTEQETSEAQRDGWTYEILPDGTAKITACSLNGDIRIPSEIDGYTVTCLKESLFELRFDIRKIYVPATVTYFGDDPSDNAWDYVFSYCFGLTAIEVDAGNPVFCSVDGVLYSKDMTILYNYPCARSGEVFYVPESTTQLACTSFASSANLKRLYITNRETGWATYTFSNTGKMTVYYLPGGRAEQTANRHISQGQSYESDTKYCRYQAVSSITPVSTPTPDSSLTDADKPLIAYIERCYLLILDRQGDKGGIDFWTRGLKAGTLAGADIVDQFCASQEFTGKRLTNQQTVEILYRTMMGREPDSGGVAYWLGFLDNGMSLHYVINGFALSREFNGICSNYGIRAGSVPLESRDQNPAVTEFVNRCYKVALGRSGDPDGLNGWTGNLLSRAMSAQEVSYAFLFSAEFEAKGYSIEDFVTRLYKLYMNRDPDAQGKSGWVSQLRQGATRKSVAQRFANSAEFEGIVRSYGLDFVPEQIPADPTQPPSPDAPLTRENILALLDAYDPDGAFIIRNSSEDSLLYWFGGDSTIGPAAYQSMNTAVHEQCHDFTHNGGWREEYIYLGNGNYMVVPYTKVYDSIEMAASVPAALRTSRFDTYVNTQERYMSSRQDGIYGLLNEFTAYCWGNHNEVQLYDYYAEHDLLGSGSRNDFVSYAEFRYYILHYMVYAKAHYPEVYNGILNNTIFKTAFASVEATFRDVVERHFQQASWIYSGYMEEYNALMNEMSKPEYVNIAKLLLS